MQVEETASSHKYKIANSKIYTLSSPTNSLRLYDHSAVCWGKYMYVWGGDNRLPKVSIKKQYNFHRVHLDNFTWETVQTTSMVPPHLHSHCCQMVGHQMFIFAGTTEDHKSNNSMWGYNFIAKVWKKYPSDKSPSPRESASMVRLNEYLVLYGGINLEIPEVYNQIYLYEIKTCTWFPLATNQPIPSRTLQKMVCLKKKIYLFGGNSDSGSALNDFYCITVVDKKQCQVQKIDTQIRPPPRLGHGMVALENKFILIIGGEKQIKKRPQLLNDAWLFDTDKKIWWEVDTRDRFQPRSYFSIVQYQNQIVIFGGMENGIIDDGMVILEIQEDLPVDNKSSREISYENLQKPYQVQKISYDFLLRTANLIKFPFAAIGLLIDNAINTQANVINISINDKQTPYPNSSPLKKSPSIQKSQKDKVVHNLKGPDEILRYILIEDDGRSWDNQDLPHIIFNTQLNNCHTTQISDRKARFQIQKDNLKKEFGNNLKLGSLRLGKGFLYISYYEGYIRAGLMMAKNHHPDDAEFLCYYFCEDVKLKRFSATNGAQMKKNIQNICKHILKPKALQQLQAYNQLYVFELRNFCTLQGIFYELNPFNNDCIFHYLPQIQFLSKIGFPIFQCPDVSLRSYLSLLYLKMQTTKITLQTDKKFRQQILNQLFIDKIDRQKEKGYVKEIEYANEYPELAECKIVELYFDQNMDQRCNSFHSGILIYQKNRLICRYKYELGLIFQLKFYRRRYCSRESNVFQFFGYIELPDGIDVNIFKTDVLHPLLLQGFNSNIRLIIKDMKRRLASKSKPSVVSKVIEVRTDLDEHKHELKHIQRRGQNLQEDNNEAISIMDEQQSQLQEDEEDDQESEYEESVMTPIEGLINDIKSENNQNMDLQK